MSFSPWKRALTVLAVACISLSALAQNLVGQPYTASMGITETVDQIMAREVLMRNDQMKEGSQENKFRPNKAPMEGLDGATYPPNEKATNDRMPYVFGTVGLQFDSANLNDTGALPPDSMGDVGPTQYLVALNGRVRVHNKTTGALGALNTGLETFFNSVRGGAGCSDPRVRFDRLTNKWYVICITVAFPNRVVLAVSSGPTITGTASFTFFQFQQDLVTPAGNTNQLLDYPTFGVDANAIYIGGNMFTSASFQGMSAWVIRKSSVQATGPMVVSVFRNITPANGAGMFTPQGCHNDDPAATTGYFIGVDNSVFSRLVVRRVSNPGGTPTLSANLNITVPTTTNPQDFVPFGSGRNVDTLDDRTYNAYVRPNPITGQPTIWTAHAIETNSAGVGTTAGDRNSARWYEIENINATPSLRQSGTMVDPAATNAARFWVPSVAVNGQGHMLIGASAANSTNLRLSTAYAGRFATDPLGTTQPHALLTTATQSYTSPGGDNPMRWGDYSMTSVDPEDNMTFWTVQEYGLTTNLYAVRVYKILAPPPAPISSVSPSTVNVGTTQNVVVTGTNPAGQGYYDPGAGFTRRLAATVSGAGVTVNSVTFNSATQVTVNLTIAPAATVGPRTLTITNPDGQFVTTSITIGSPNVVINGNVTLGDLIPDENGRLVSYAIYQGPTLVINAARVLGPSGSYSITLPGLANGNYSILFKGSHWLTKKINFTVSGPVVNGVNGTLVNGDVDGDDEVGPGDFGLLATAFLSVDGDPNWNPEADLDGDGEVGPGDFSILATNFLQSGDTP